MSLLEELIPSTATVANIYEEPKSYVSTDEDVRKTQALQVDIAMGTGSPGLDTIENALLSGEEINLRNAMAADKDTRRQEVANQTAFDLVSSGEVTDPSFIKDVATVEPTSPETVVEEDFFNNFVNSVLATGENKEIDTEVSTKPQFWDAYDQKTQGILKKLLINKISNEYKDRYKNWGWGPWAVGQAASIAEFPSWLNFARVKEGGISTEGGLSGNVIHERVLKIRSLPPAEMSVALKAELEGLWSFNPVDAMAFLDAFENPDDSTFVSMNFQNVISATPFGLLAKAGKGAKVAETVGSKLGKEAAESLKSFEQYFGPAEKVIDDVAKAATKKITTVPEALSDVGKVGDAAVLAAKERVIDDLYPKTSLNVRKQMAKLAERTPDIFNPNLKVTGYERLYSKAAGIMQDYARGVIARTSDVLTGSGAVEILPPQALNKAMAEAEQRLKDMIPNVENYILQTTYHAPEDNFGVGLVDFTIGKNPTDLFPERFDALQFAKQNLKLPEDSFFIEQVGTGYGIHVYKPIQAVGSESVDNLVLETGNLSKNKGGVLKTGLQQMLGDSTRVSDFQAAQRSLVAKKFSGMSDMLQELRGPMQKLYDEGEKQAWEDFTKILEINKRTLRNPADPDSIGVYWKTPQEVREGYMQHLKRFPTQMEQDAYFNYVMLSDLDLYLHSVNIWRAKTLKGISNHNSEIYSGDGSKINLSFEGTRLNEFPGKVNTSFIYISEDGVVSLKNFSRLKDIERETMTLGVNSGKASLVKRSNLDDATIEKQLGHDISQAIYVYSEKSSFETPLDMSKMLNRNEGGHIVWKDSHFVKGADVVDNEYRGDITFAGAQTQREAEDFASKMTKAASFSDEVALENYLRDNLPFTLKEWKGLLQKGKIKKGMKFAGIKAGSRISDNGVKLGNGKFLREEYPNIDEFSIGSYNDLYKGADDFTQERQGPLRTIKPGGEGNPVYRLDNADMLDPIVTQINSMGKLIRNTLYEDYQFSAAKSWVEEFGSRLGLMYEGKQVTPAQMRRNPVFYLKHGELPFKTDTIGSLQAQQIRSAILRLVGQPSKTQLALDSFQHSLADKITNRKASIYVSNLEIPFIKDPFSYARAVATNIKMGFWNPVQLFVQGSAMANLSMIYDPGTVLKAAKMSWGMKTLDWTMDSKILDHMAGLHWKASGDITKDMFKESLYWKNYTNFDKVGQEYATLDNIRDTVPFISGTKKFMNKGMTLFNGIERTLRLSSWNSAYIEYIEKYPKKAGKLTKEDAQKIWLRADAGYVNMTRDKNSWWQRGITGNFTQFFAYNVRMFELMLPERLGGSSQLSGAEKARLILGNSLLYGVGGSLVFGDTMATLALSAQEGDAGLTASAFNPFADDIRTEALKRGYELDGTAAGVIYNGLMSTAFSLATYAVTGEEKYLDVGGRYGPNFGFINQSLDGLKQSLEEHGVITGVILAAMGASGSIVGDIFSSISPVYSDLVQMAGGSGSTNILVQDVLNGTREISTMNNLHKLVFGLTGTQYISKNGSQREEGPMSKADRYSLLMSALTGLSENKEADTFRMMKVLRERKEDISELKKRLAEIDSYIMIAKKAGREVDIPQMKKQREVLINSYPLLTPRERNQLALPQNESYGKNVEDAFDKIYRRPH